MRAYNIIIQYHTIWYLLYHNIPYTTKSVYSCVEAVVESYLSDQYTP